MAKRRKRRSAPVLAERALKDIRTLHRAHLKQISAILSNTLGFRVRVMLVPNPQQVEARLGWNRPAKVDRTTAHVAGWGGDKVPPELSEAPNLPDDGIGF
jgi:hypothetical protein